MSLLIPQLNRNIVFYAIIFIIMATQTLSADIEVSSGRLFSHVEKLLRTPRARNFYNVGSLDSAASYIKSQFVKMGYTPREQVYEVDTNEYRNICVLIGPVNTQRIVVGAHYDVCGDQPGADDNASGIAGLLELARIVRENEERLTSQIEFVAYTLEEPPIYDSSDMGSYVHAQSLKKQQIDVRVMICLEMIGFFSEEKIQQYPILFAKLFYPSRANFIAVVGNFRSRRYIKQMRNSINTNASINCRSMAINAPGIDLSDHRNYWLFGYKAMMITDTSFFRYKYYHTEFDTMDHLDFGKMAEVVKGVASFLLSK